MTTPRDQLYFDIFVTALEGGIQYWAQVNSYHWHHSPENSADPADYGREDVFGFYADIDEVGDNTCDDERVNHRIDRAVIARGYGLASGEWRKKTTWSTEPPPLNVTDDTDWDFDAGDADTIVQLGLGLIDTIRSTGQLCVRYG